MLPSGRDTFDYREDDHHLTVFAERSKEPDFLIYSESINHWDPPFEGDAISAEKKAQVLRNVCLWFEARGKSYKVV